jgi:Zn ribbon nucleic-acid-binding protein
MRCPECQSTNYMQLREGDLHRCYDCGFPVVSQINGNISLEENNLEVGKHD